MTVPFIVMCAPNGARRSKQDHAALPLTADELATCAESVLGAGASMLHVHVRDDDGRHALDPDRYRGALAAIRERVGDRLVLQVTTEACGFYTPQQQMQVIRELEPEAVSLALAELCPDTAGEDAAAEFFGWLQANLIMAQYILYSKDDALRFEDLRRRGVIPDAWPFVLFVLGRYSEALTGDPSQLDELAATLSRDVGWAVCCFGQTENAAVIRAAGIHGHARVGFENNLQLPNGTLAEDNADLVRLAADAGKAVGRHIASADDVRTMFAP